MLIDEMGDSSFLFYATGKFIQFHKSFQNNWYHSIACNIEKKKILNNLVNTAIGGYSWRTNTKAERLPAGGLERHHDIPKMPTP